jgi:hypothetical protein
MLQAAPDDLTDLIASLAGPLAPPPGATPARWHAWQIAPIDGGRNGRVFRATTVGQGADSGEQIDLVVKLTARDRHDRAGREYRALQAVAEAGLDIAPRPVLLERDRFQTQVVVMTWLDGTVSDDLPATDDAWHRLIEHLVAVNAITPARTGLRLAESVLSMRSPAEGIQRIHTEVDAIPRPDQPPALRRLVERFERHPYPSWPAPPTVLRRGDANIRNIVRRPGAWASVDWEYSGWSDPAFEVADLIAHAAYLAVPAERWAWVRRRYADLVGDPEILSRVDIYTVLMYGFWAGRLARMLYQVPRGLDERPAPWPAGWLETVQRNYQRYLERANLALG